MRSGEFLGTGSGPHHGRGRTKPGPRVGAQSRTGIGPSHGWDWTHGPSYGRGQSRVWDEGRVRVTDTLKTGC